MLENGKTPYPMGIRLPQSEVLAAMSTPEEMQLTVALLFVVLVWAAAWISFSVIFSRISGWSAVARSYPAREASEGPRWYFQSAVLRHFFSSRNALIVRADPQGVTFAALLFFRAGFPAFSVPWNEISGRQTRWGFRKAVELRFRQTPSIPVTIGSRLAQRLEEASLGQWRYERLAKENPESQGGSDLG